MKGIKALLDYHANKFNNHSFIENDPIQIPHQFNSLQDIEIMGFWTAMLAWGQRVTIINKSKELVELMGGAPHDFIVNHTEKDRIPFLQFKHRTFQATDTLYFLEFLQQHYRNNQSLESAFTNTLAEDAPTIQTALSGFHNYFFSLKDAPQRTRKHVATPDRKSSCKRLNMFLRWMVRKDNQGIDFGLWSNINPSQLMIPLDVHVQRIATKLGLLTRKQTDWKAVEELTDVLRAMNPEDPVKYDFALFGLGVLEEEPFEQVVAAFL